MSTQLDRIEAHAREAAQVSARVDVLESRLDGIADWQSARDRGVQCAAGLQQTAAVARDSGAASAWRGWAGWLVMAVVGALIGYAMSHLGVSP